MLGISDWMRACTVSRRILFHGVSCGVVVGNLPMEDRKGLILCDVSSLCCSLQARMKMTFELPLGIC